MIKKTLIRSINDLYGIKDIAENGVIKTNKCEVIIYKIEPANILACDENTKNKICQAYLTCIRGLPDTFQLIISKEKTNLKSQIRLYKARMLKVENFGLKLALQKYIQYLEKLEETNKLYKTSYYLIVENLDGDARNEILSLFSNMQEFGIRIEIINSKKEIEMVLRQAAIQGGNTPDEY